MSGLTTRQLADKQDRQPRRRKGLLQADTMLQDRYKILETLGVGGFSSVYQARDMHFSSVTRVCAVKEMFHIQRDAKARELATQSFEREASILATLDHPAVPDVYDFFTEADRSYLVLEYIHGKDLEALLADQNTFFPTEKVIDWAIQICDVLDYLHHHKPQPVVFRDLKPSNIMLDRHGRIRLIDFNIAKLFQTGIKGTMIGTEGYSPPEQYRGEASPAGDIYSLGATMHHLLTQQDPRTEPPFSFTERPILEINASVPATLVTIIDRCLTYAASERYQRASDLRRDLIAVVGRQQAPPGVPGDPFLDPLGRAPSAGEQPLAVPGIMSQSQVASLLWRFKCEDEIRSTAAIQDGVILLGAYDNNLYAIGSKKGEFIWKYPATGSIASSPTIYGDSVLVGSVDGYMYCLIRNNGQLKWRFQTGGPIYSSPQADFDHVFFGSDDGYLYALHSGSGRKVWQSSAHNMIRSTPCLGRDRIYFGTEGGYVFCLDLSGRVKWQFQAKRAVTSSPELAEDMIFVGSMDGTVYAVDATSGWAIWRFRTRRPVVSSPVVVDGSLFVGSSDGNMYALDVFNGRQLWHFAAEGQINASPAVYDNAVYFGATDGVVYSVDAKRGKLRWRYVTNGVIVSSPVVKEGVVYVGSCDHHLYALPA